MSAADQLVSSLRQVAQNPPVPTSAEDVILRGLCRLADRASQSRFQLAVVGQFKRGKSSLLNALLGAQVLPTGVVPLTAIPTFISFGADAALSARFQDGSVESWKVASDDALQAALADLATETGNPHNEKGLEGVDLRYPAEILRDGLVLIDTPGIGSVERHNSETALAALPECDAALLVLSPDPPITEAELQFVAEIQKNAARLIPVLNKMDLTEGADLETSLAYVERVLADRGIAHEPVLAVSAKRALVPGGSTSREESGMAGLERKLQEFGRSEREQILLEAVARKGAEALAQLGFHNEMVLAALRLPAEQLDEKLRLIDDRASRLVGEKKIAPDLLTGERRRLLRQIEEDAETVRAKARTILGAELDKCLRDGADGQVCFARLADVIPGFFDAAFRKEADEHCRRLGEIYERARERIEEVLTDVWREASSILGARFAPPEVVRPMPDISDPSWDTRERESMNPLPRGLVARLLPASLTAGVQRRRLEGEVERLVRLNAERFRWKFIQAANHALLQFERTFAAAIEEAACSLGEIVSRVRAKRNESGDAAATETEARARWQSLLERVQSELRRNFEVPAAPVDARPRTGS